ncbi:fungal-specific transcription factor domain-containing protein [Pyronema omphalodes]|nr:fungal-specific transcription factor domain-containing protein [Pyronema omphalodes]
MTPTPPSSNSSHSPQDHQLTASNHAFRVVRKRNRVPLSCGPCRNRKLKCNRQTPCENCVRRNDASSCTYATNTHSARHRKPSNSSSSSDEMQSRIDRLEGLVLSLMSGNSNNVSVGRQRTGGSSSGGAVYSESQDGELDEYDESMGYDDHDEQYEREGGRRNGPSSVEEEVEEVRNALGIMKVQEGKTFYRGETHWAALLSEVTEVRRYFEETKQKWENEIAAMRCTSTISRLQATGFPFSAGPPPSKKDLLALVPANTSEVDRLVDAYFRNHNPLFRVLHQPTFRRQLEQFKENPEGVEILWLGLLMVVMSIAIKIHDASGEPPIKLPSNTDTITTWHAFRSAAEQCLVVGEYTKKLYVHTVQTLILLCLGTTDDNSWLHMGSVIRIAMSMGLHRDPGQFPAISPGEAEIRRRLWTQITCIDLLTSIQIGLPSMVNQDECDTRLPMNLNDDDISEDTVTLPPERGKEQITDVCYMISKASMAHKLCEVIKQVNSVKARPPYEQILKLEKEINSVYEEIPHFLRQKPIENSQLDPAWLIIQRHNLDLLRQMAFLALHRPYAARARSNPRYTHSYHQCVGAAMALLKHQDELYTLGTTYLRHVRWYTDTHSTQEYLGAAMIVCMDLNDPHKNSADPEERKRRFQALCRARDIHRNLRDINIDASKAEGVIDLMLTKLMKADSTLSGQASQPPELSEATSPPSDPTVPLKSEQAAAMTLGMMSGGGLTPNSAFATLYDRPATVTTPGGSLDLPDATPGVTSPGNGWNSLQWHAQPPVGFEGQGLEWDDWDEFMKEINLGDAQLGGYPMVNGLGMFPGGHVGGNQNGMDIKRDREG